VLDLGFGFGFGLQLGQLDQGPCQAAQVGWVLADSANPDAAFAVMKRSAHSCNLLSFPEQHDKAHAAKTLKDRGDCSGDNPCAARTV
jgi:hypothetical protein